MTKETPKAMFLLPKLLHEAPDQAGCDAWLKRAYPRNQPGNLVIGRYTVEQACERWNKYHD